MAIEEVSDTELVGRVQAGDRQAFDLLVLRYQQRLLKMVTRYTKDYTEALDITQEAFLRAYRSLEDFRGDSAFFSWLYRIAINTTKNYLVTRGKHLHFDLDIKDSENTQDLMDELASDNNNPESLLLCQELEDTIQKAIDELSEDIRTALMLREMMGLSYEEIADAMHCPIGTVRSRIFRARDALDAKIHQLVRGEDAD